MGTMHLEQPVDRPWQEPLRRRMSELELGYEPLFAVVEMDGAGLASALESLGAIDPAALPVCWSFQAGSVDRDRGLDRPFLAVNGSRVRGFTGAFVFTLEGRAYGVARVATGVSSTTVPTAASLEQLTGLVGRIRATDAARRRQS